MALTKISRSLLDTGVSDSSDATAITIDSSENVGIGETSPLGKVHIKSGDTGASSVSSDKSDLVIENNSHAGITTLSTDSTESGMFFGHASDTRAGEIHTRYDTTTMTIGTRMSGGLVKFLSDDGTERMRIDSGGGVAIGTTSPDGVSNLTVKSQNSTSGQEFVSLHHQATSGLVYFISFMTEASGVDRGYITYNNSGNTMQFTLASDEILKENIRDLTGGLDFINQIKPRIFDWKEEGRGKDQVGFIAQEIEEIKPEWVGEKEGLKNIPADLTGTVPYLIKAIQEQQEQIEALQAEINTLKGE